MTELSLAADEIESPTASLVLLAQLRELGAVVDDSVLMIEHDPLIPKISGQVERIDHVGDSATSVLKKC